MGWVAYERRLAVGRTGWPMKLGSCVGWVI